MADHGVRAHATWSASATARNWGCAGALTMAKAFREVESEAAAWGTAAHQVAEKCLRTGKDASAFIDTVEKTKAHVFEVDEEMVQTVQLHLDYIRQRIGTYRAGGADVSHPYVMLIEQRFELDSLNPPFDAGGTADVVLWFPAWGLLEVVDLKGGRGVVVEVKDNPQLRTYGLGALLKNQQWPVQKVRTTIVQPRAGHRDGHVRHDTVHVADLIEWTANLLEAMGRAHMAELEFAGCTDVNAWRAKWLSAGEHCRFCPAAEGYACPALEKYALDKAGAWFGPQGEINLPQVGAMSPQEIADRLDAADMIQEWLNSVRAYAKAKADSGMKIPGYGLVDKIGHRAWKTDPEDIEGYLTDPHVGLTKEDVYTKKLKSPAQIEKVLGATRKHLIDEMYERPRRGTTLVRLDKTDKPEVTPKVTPVDTREVLKGAFRESLRRIQDQTPDPWGLP